MSKRKRADEETDNKQFDSNLIGLPIESFPSSLPSSIVDSDIKFPASSSSQPIEHSQDDQFQDENVQYLLVEFPTTLTDEQWKQLKCNEIQVNRK
jgi:hypothetical protein